MLNTYKVTNQISKKSFYVDINDNDKYLSFNTYLDFFDIRIYDIVDIKQLNNKKLFTLQSDYNILVTFKHCKHSYHDIITAKQLNKLYSNQHNRIYKAHAFFVLNLIDKCNTCKKAR